MSLVAAVLWLLAAAHAAPSHARVTWKALPSPADHAQMNAGGYYEVLVVREYGKVEKVVARVRLQVTTGDVEDMDESYIALQETLETARTRLANFPPWKEQTALADAIVGAYDTWHALSQRERDEAVGPTVTVPLSDKDIKRFEKIRLELDGEWEKSNEAVRKVIAEFAEGERLVFKANATNSDSDPFAAEGLPPPNSKLPPALWVSKAIAYHNVLHDHTTSMVGAMNEMSAKMNSPELQDARVEALEIIKPALDDAKRYGPIGGDQAYRDAVVAYGDWMVGQLEGPVKQHADLTEDGAIEEEEIEVLNGISDQLNAGAAERAKVLDGARRDFMAAWHIDPYLSWRKTQKKR